MSSDLIAWLTIGIAAALTVCLWIATAAASAYRRRVIRAAALLSSGALAYVLNSISRTESVDVRSVGWPFPFLEWRRQGEIWLDFFSNSLFLRLGANAALGFAAAALIALVATQVIRRRNGKTATRTTLR